MLCKTSLPEQIKRIAEDKGKPDMLILREKDLPVEEYKALAIQIKEICDNTGICFIPHSFVEVARELHCTSIHLPLHLLEAEQKSGSLEGFSVIGASVHSVEEAKRACKAGAGYLTAGHIFPTECKAGLPGRGIEFLKAVCKAVPIPVYAIGGIKKEHEEIVRTAGAAGACRMSDYMKSE